MDVQYVTAISFRAALAEAQATSERVAGATTPAADIPNGARYYLTPDRKSGYGVNGDELIAVFSLVKGRGSDLVRSAITSHGARRLDAFDGFLPTFYGRFGFAEVAREPNWTPGEPDVVYMALAA